MADTRTINQNRSNPNLLNERRLSVLVHSLFSAWMLSLLFEGQILYGLTSLYAMDPGRLVLEGMVFILAGMLFWGHLIHTKKGARRMFLGSYPVFAALSAFFYLSPTPLWEAAIIGGAFLAGGCVSAWAFFLKSSTPRKERIKTVADLLILSNCFMILLNVVSIHQSPLLSLGLSMMMLVIAFAFALRLPSGESHSSGEEKGAGNSLGGVLAFLCLFIAIITINSGLMYQVINPAFSDFQWLASWYWSIPYIAAILIMRNLPSRINRAYILYVAIAMMGLAFIGFMSFSPSVASYLLVNTLMLGAFGVYDLFWWSILAEMLEFHKKPGKIFGLGLSANVLGVLVGGIIGQAVRFSVIDRTDSILLALALVCLTLILLPPLHKHLAILLKDHVYLLEYPGMSSREKPVQMSQDVFRNLSERERQVAGLLLQGKTYRTIASELIISENTVKYYVKNIYSKFDIQSRAELIELALKKE